MTKEGLEKALVEGIFLEKSYQRITGIIKKVFNGTYRKKIFKKIDKKIAAHFQKKLRQKVEIQPNKILFLTTRGSYNCNPKAIVEEIIRQNLPWEMVWVARKENLKAIEQYPEELKIVRRDSYEFYKEAASARIWVDNSVGMIYMGARKKNGQVLFETWHGSFGLKRFETSNDCVWLEKAAIQGKDTDYCLSNSAFERDLFRNTFWKNSEILEYGHPRNDILLTDDENKIEKVKSKVYRELQISEGMHVALYAPTFRDNKSLKPYSLDYDLLRETLQKKFGGDWVIVVRLHFEIKKMLKKRKIEYPEFVVDATEYEDIQDILLVTDVGITDYSSWVCDYVLTKRPAFFFATDLDQFFDERGFYYPLESTPFAIAKSNEELVSNILNFDNQEYVSKCEDYLSRMGCMETGNASVQMVEKMKEIIG